MNRFWHGYVAAVVAGNALEFYDLPTYLFSPSLSAEPSFRPAIRWYWRLNQVELWFAKIQRDVIRRGVFTSVADLGRKLRPLLEISQALLLDLYRSHLPNPP